QAGHMRLDHFAGIKTDLVAGIAAHPGYMADHAASAVVIRIGLLTRYAEMFGANGDEDFHSHGFADAVIDVQGARKLSAFDRHMIRLVDSDSAREYIGRAYETGNKA